MLAYPLFAVGLIFLVLGGDWLVKGSVGLAESIGIPPLIIGLTIVAFGTSAPELVISLDAALSGSGSLAVGNVVGSNIANVLLVLGFPALFASIACTEKGIKTTIGFLFGVTAIFMLQLASGTLTRFHGLMLLLLLGAFLFQQFAAARKQKQSAQPDYLDDVGEVPHSTRSIVSYLLIGLITLPLAAHLTVNSAVDIAEAWNVPEAIIGLTIVAIGTSLPELATGISAARQGKTSLAVGNVIGSNLFNIAAIMGITAVVLPLPVEGHIIKIDMWVMAVTTVLLMALPFFKLSIGKKTGMLLLACYASYLVSTVAL